ncbi:Hypothetical_protein [Hexamita inflata]|uniref:Hypothetical_protein n=1 Tax=Hexamita inflata TaxID=28002 RepID=A0AA86QV11_9EUKA|nr:Hypothetical protein HINF_LOCUS52790 [Hexamita inflata]
MASLSSTSVQLNILSRVSTGSSIRNLYVKMLISSLSQGIITLIGSQSNALNIKNYQIAGSYYSKQCMSLAVQYSNVAHISITNVNFRPNIYIFGNQSSYLFAYVISSSVQIKQLVLSVGSTSANSMQTVQSSTNSNQFYGGIISQIYISSVILLNSAIQAYLQQTTNYLNSSGVLIGTSGNATIISINNLCAFEQTTFTGSVVNQSGLFGTIGGKIAISNANINYTVSGDGQFLNFGTIGILTVDCQKGSFNYLQITFISLSKSSYNDTEINVAALIGLCVAKYFVVNNSNIYGNVSAASCVALVSGSMNSNTTINTLYLSNSNILSQSISGGVSGRIALSCIIQGLQIENIFVKSQVNGKNTYSAGIFGFALNIKSIVQLSKINNITVFSQSFINAESFASGLISYSTNSSLVGEEIKIQNNFIESQSQNKRGPSSGFLSYAEQCQIKFSQLQSDNVTITSNSCIPGSSGIAGLISFSELYLTKIFINGSTIMGTDVLFRTGNITSVAMSTGVLLNAINCSVQIQYINILLSTITLITKQLTVAAGITGYALNSNLAIMNISTINSHINCSSLEYNSHSGTINALVQSTSEYLLNIQIQNIIITIFSFIDSYVGGLIGWLNGLDSSIIAAQIQGLSILSDGGGNTMSGGFVGQIMKTNITLQLSSITNSNISSKSISTSCTGSVLGNVQDIQIVVIDNVNLVNIINNNIGNYVFSGSFIGRYTSNISSSLTQITNSAIFSIQIHYSAYNYKYINLIFGVVPALNTNIISTASTKSLGFSSINGITISNCENVQVQNINGNNFISENGCV